MERKHIFDNPRNVKKLLLFFYITLGVLVVVDFFIDKHPHFLWEAWPQFFAVFGFVACVCLVLVAKYVLRPLVRRGERYYD